MTANRKDIGPNGRSSVSSVFEVCLIFISFDVLLSGSSTFCKVLCRWIASPYFMFFDQFQFPTKFIIFALYNAMNCGIQMIRFQTFLSTYPAVITSLFSARNRFPIEKNPCCLQNNSIQNCFWKQTLILGACTFSGKKSCICKKMLLWQENLAFAIKGCVTQPATFYCKCNIFLPMQHFLANATFSCH